MKLNHLLHSSGDTNGFFIQTCQIRKVFAYFLATVLILKFLRKKIKTDGNLLALYLIIEDNNEKLIDMGLTQKNLVFMKTELEIFFEFDKDYFILSGDFNLTLIPFLDTCNYTGGNKHKAGSKVLKIMEDLQLLDYHRNLKPD